MTRAHPRLEPGRGDARRPMPPPLDRPGRRSGRRPHPRRGTDHQRDEGQVMQQRVEPAVRRGHGKQDRSRAPAWRRGSGGRHRGPRASRLRASRRVPAAVTTGDASRPSHGEKHTTQSTNWRKGFRCTSAGFRAGGAGFRGMGADFHSFEAHFRGSGAGFRGRGACFRAVAANFRASEAHFRGCGANFRGSGACFRGGEVHFRGSEACFPGSEACAPIPGSRFSGGGDGPMSLNAPAPGGGAMIRSGNAANH